MYSRYVQRTIYYTLPAFDLRWTPDVYACENNNNNKKKQSFGQFTSRREKRLAFIFNACESFEDA